MANICGIIFENNFGGINQINKKSIWPPQETICWSILSRLYFLIIK